MTHFFRPLLSLLAFLLLALAATLGPPAAAQLAPAASAPPTQRLLFIATGNVPKGKFRQLQQIAAPHGLSVEVRYLNTIPAQAGPSCPRRNVFGTDY